MTDEEMTVIWIKENADSCRSNNMNAYEFAEQAFLAGLKAGKDMADADLAAVAYMQGAERYKTKWHKVADGDLPKGEGGWVSNQDGLPCFFDWSTEQWLDCEGTQIRTTEWCHMPHKE